jgi:hypothetical protein
MLPEAGFSSKISGQLHAAASLSEGAMAGSLNQFYLQAGYLNQNRDKMQHT